MNNTFSHGLELTKGAILKLNVPDADQQLLAHVESWTHSAHVLEPKDCVRAVVDGAWATAFRRYRLFHHDLLDLRPRPHRRRRQRKPHEIL